LKERDQSATAIHDQLYVLSDGTQDRDSEIRDVLLGKAFPRRASVIDTAGLHALLEAGRG
jgi:hypothetical protein